MFVSVVLLLVLLLMLVLEQHLAYTIDRGYRGVSSMASGAHAPYTASHWYRRPP